jgi:hypothetical protein
MMELPPGAISDEEFISMAVRNERNQHLANCDWTHSASDRPVPNKEEWAEYRQALRDITKQEGFPYDILWPTLPGTQAPQAIEVSRV